MYIYSRCQEVGQPPQSVTPPVQTSTNSFLKTSVPSVPLSVATPGLTLSSPALPATQSLFPSMSAVLSQLPGMNTLLQPQLPSPGLPQLQVPSVQAATTQVPCTCGVFLSGQFVKGGNQQPTGLPALLHEHDEVFTCNAFGNKQCTNKCLDIVSGNTIRFLL